MNKELDLQDTDAGIRLTIHCWLLMNVQVQLVFFTRHLEMYVIDAKTFDRLTERGYVVTCPVCCDARQSRAPVHSRCGRCLVYAECRYLKNPNVV